MIRRTFLRLAAGAALGISGLLPELAPRHDLPRHDLGFGFRRKLNPDDYHFNFVYIKLEQPREEWRISVEDLPGTSDCYRVTRVSRGITEHLT